MGPLVFLVDLSSITVLNAPRALFAQIVTTGLGSLLPPLPSNAKSVWLFCQILPVKLVKIHLIA
jgi:hypothetical protein